MNKLLSVIIPVYNGEKYIERCLNSVLAQTYRKLEIIIINDGSHDKSLSILKEYEKKDNRIILIDQVNQGSSKTRNNGIEIANGEYITFVDIDDYIEIDTYSKALRIIEEADIICYGASYDYIEQNYSIFKPLKNGWYDSQKAIELLFELGIFNPVWNKIYKSDLIKNKCYFPKEFNQGEDLIFNCQAFENASKIYMIKDPLYHYLYQEGATMISSFTKNNDIVLKYKQKAVKKLLRDADEQIYYDYMLKEYEVFVINLYLKGNDVSFKGKIDAINNNLIDNMVLKKGIPDNTYGRIFKFLANMNTYCLVIGYYLLTFAKNIVGNNYTIVRKIINK